MTRRPQGISPTIAVASVAARAPCFVIAPMHKYAGTPAHRYTEAPNLELVCFNPHVHLFICPFLRFTASRLMCSIRFEKTQGRDRQTNVSSRSFMVAHLFHTHCLPCPEENGLGLENGVLARAVW